MSSRDVREFRRTVIKLAAQITALILVLLVALGAVVFAIVSASQSEITVTTAIRHEQQEELQRLLSALLIAGAIAGVAASLLGAWLAARAMRPMSDALILQRRFVADASHELRTPLTVLSTRAQLLRRKLPADGATPADPVVALWADELVDDARVLTEILEDLLIAADPRETAARSEFDLGTVADAVLMSFQATAEYRGLVLEREGGGTVTVDGAPTSIRRLITALVSNAIDHARSRVVVEISRDRGGAIIRVADDGPGFGNDKASAFGRFASNRVRHADATSTRHYGLGLALVAEVAARHGGSVVVEDSTLGHPGAVIVVHIPDRHRS